MQDRRVAPTVPRLELTASVLSVKVSRFLKEEFDFPIDEEFFWTDSQVVLAYIQNETKRFHLFVANRVKLIGESTQLGQWKYVPSKLNPADDATRGLKFSTSEKNERWVNGPEFLYTPKEEWPTKPTSLTISNEDKEIKKMKCNTAVVSSFDVVIKLLEKITSKWHKMNRIVATILS